MIDEEQQLRGRIAAAERARAYIDDPLLVGAFDALDARFLLAWRNSPAGASDVRERIWHHIQALAEVRAELNSALTDGALARAALDELAEPTDNP